MPGVNEGNRPVKVDGKMTENREEREKEFVEEKKGLASMTRAIEDREAAQRQTSVDQGIPSDALPQADKLPQELRDAIADLRRQVEGQQAPQIPRTGESLLPQFTAEGLGARQTALTDEEKGRLVPVSGETASPPDA